MYFLGSNNYIYSFVPSQVSCGCAVSYYSVINLKLCSLCDSVEKLSNGRLGTSSTAALMGSPESGSFSPG